ncbi:hypothetical protein BGZ54_006171, partial [Gamsiella multidivaricata]
TGSGTGIGPGTSAGSGYGGKGSRDEVPPLDKDKIRRMLEQTRAEKSKLQARYGAQVPAYITTADPTLKQDLERLDGQQHPEQGTGLEGVSNGSGRGRGRKQSREGDEDDESADE